MQNLYLISILFKFPMDSLHWKGKNLNEIITTSEDNYAIW